MVGKSRMNRREFLTLGLFLPVFPKLAMSNHIESTNDSMAFPVVFSESVNHTNEASISYFKQDSIFEQLWRDILRIIR